MPQPAVAGGRVASAGRAVAATAGGAFAVQVGSMSTRSAAEDLVKRAAAKGHDARIVGSTAPFKVWVGQLRTRGEAATLAEALKRDGFRGAFVVAGGR
jgi:cell division septation protein DedD